MQKKVVIYTKYARNVSGVQTFERNLMLALKDYYELIYVYDVGDLEIIEEFKRYATVIQNVQQTIECDICIYSSIFHTMNRIFASRYMQVIHTDLFHWKVKYNPYKINTHIAVSEQVQKSLKENNGIDSIVIPNVLAKPAPEKVLRLLTASRIDNGKGFDRVIKMARLLKESKLKFIWEIYGSGSQNYLFSTKQSLQDIPEVVFLGEQTNIQSYMVNCDYVVQLSDNEGFCYSVYEGLQLKKPAIITRWEGAENTIQEGVNGYILDMDLGNLDISKLYEQIPKLKSLDVKNNIQKWIDLIE